MNILYTHFLSITLAFGMICFALGYFGKAKIQNKLRAIRHAILRPRYLKFKKNKLL